MSPGEAGAELGAVGREDGLSEVSLCPLFGEAAAPCALFGEAGTPCALFGEAAAPCPPVWGGWSPPQVLPSWVGARQDGGHREKLAPGLPAVGLPCLRHCG